MSDTPRMDMVAGSEYALETAKQIERELAAMTQERNALLLDVGTLQKVINIQAGRDKPLREGRIKCQKDLNAMTTRAEKAEARLAREIKWGHRHCILGDCRSSGENCPMNPEQIEKGTT